MNALMRRQEITKFLNAALECSIYLCPRDPGLSHEELIEIGKRVGYDAGEIFDTLPGVAAQAYFGDTKVKPGTSVSSSQFLFPEEPDFRKVEAFDFVAAQLQDLARKQGLQGARIERSVLVARAVHQKLREMEVEAAITIMLLDEHLVSDANGTLSFAPGRNLYPLASEQVAQNYGTAAARQLIMKKPERSQAYPLVKDVVERRTDGRQKSAEPLDAFSDALERLGYGRFRLWWRQTVAELRNAEPTLSPVATTVFAAALVEAALTFVVKHARALGLGVLGSRSLDGDPKTWKIDDLVSSAAAGQASAILDVATRHRADELIRARQRIHAGRMLSEFPDGPPDLRPEEARAARESAEVIVRRVLDWLERNRVSTQ